MKQLTEEKKSKIDQLLQTTELSQTVIAERFGVSTTYIGGRLRELGLRTAKRGAFHGSVRTPVKANTK